MTAGAGDSAAATHTTEFTLNVETAGPGCLVFTAPDAKAPQLDKFDIKSPGTPVPPISAVELEAAVKAAKGLDLNDYKDDDAKTALLQNWQRRKNFLQTLPAEALREHRTR